MLTWWISCRVDGYRLRSRSRDRGNARWDLESGSQRRCRIRGGHVFGGARWGRGSGGGLCRAIRSLRGWMLSRSGSMIFAILRRIEPCGDKKVNIYSYSPISIAFLGGVKCSQTFHGRMKVAWSTYQSSSVSCGKDFEWGEEESLAEAEWINFWVTVSRQLTCMISVSVFGWE